MISAFMIDPGRRSRALLAATVLASFSLVQCSKSASPTVPSTLPALLGVALSTSSLAEGGTAQGTVSLTVAAPAGGSSISLSSSDTSVATVPALVVVQAGASSATFAIAAVATGAVTITAGLSGATSQSPPFSVTARLAVAISSLSLSALSVVGGDQATGTVMLTGAASGGGATVLLAGGDPLTLPASVTVLPGSTSATFAIATRAVSETTKGNISGSYGGASASAVLTVTRRTAGVASFTVAGPNAPDTCLLTNGGNTLNCTFDGSASTAPGTIIGWDWSYSYDSTFGQTTPGPKLTMPSITCNLVPLPPLPPNREWLAMTVRLTVRDSLGNVSEEAVNKGIRLFPQGACGF